MRVDRDLIGEDANPQLCVFEARFDAQRQQHDRKRIIPFLDELLRCALEKVADKLSNVRVSLPNESLLLCDARTLALQFLGAIRIEDRLLVFSSVIQNLAPIGFVLRALQGELTQACALQLLARIVARRASAAQGIECLAELAHVAGWRSRFSSISLACTAIMTGC